MVNLYNSQTDAVVNRSDSFATRITPPQALQGAGNLHY